ncbi:MAG TPA: sigma-70 family RNA polymerase sigma factor, partial [Planctomycetota bacterium]|nr:sigma-70 family RNA polymerase sigma factor [Planctomycetota bacterium]
MNEPASVSADALAGDLLRHGRFVRNVAANLVAGADADDATQETWLAALRRPPRENGLAAWLRRVARNAALRILRSEGRRERRETAAARPEAVVAADALEVEDRERRLRAVYDAVLALDPPFRDVVLCRFYDGLEAAEIAARLGVPAATVRTRLHRALEKLRGALDAAYGDRGSWTAALLPLAFPAWPAAAVAAAGAAATTSAVAGSAAAGGGIWSGAMLGGLIMAKKAAVAAALSAAVLATAWFALGGDEAPPPKAPESVVVQGPTAASRGPTVEPAASPTPSSAPIAATPFAPERERFDDVDAAPAASVGRVVRVTGRVTTEDGKPVADAAVRVRPGVGVFDDGGAPPETTTGADGRFTLDVPRRAEEAVARARSATLADALLVFAMPADGAVDLGDLVARRGGAVSGTVRDERGAPVAGARVSGAPASTAARLPRWGAARDPDAARQVVADAAGRYVLRGLAEGEAEIEAWSDDRPLAARSGVRVIPGQTTLDVDFALVDGRTLEGVVRDRRGDPVAGARVRADREATTFGEAADPDRTATADDRGRFVLRGLRDGGYRLVARRQGYLAASASASPGGDPAVLTLDTVGGVYGRVVDERGEPVADFKASVVRADATSFMTFGAAKVVAAPGRAPARVLYGAEAAQALGEAPGPGWYYAPEAPFREASVLVDAPGFASNRVDGVRPPSGERVRADVTLKAERAVTGVVRGPDGAPAAGAMVTVATPEEDAAPAVAVDGPRRAVRRVAVAGAGGGAAGRALSPATVGRSYSAVAGPDGTFRVGGLDDGVYRVVASRADALASA